MRALVTASLLVLSAAWLQGARSADGAGGSRRFGESTHVHDGVVYPMPRGKTYLAAESGRFDVESGTVDGVAYLVVLGNRENDAARLFEKRSDLVFELDVNGDDFVDLVIIDNDESVANGTSGVFAGGVYVSGTTIVNTHGSP